MQRMKAKQHRIGSTTGHMHVSMNNKYAYASLNTDKPEISQKGYILMNSSINIVQQ